MKQPDDMVTKEPVTDNADSLTKILSEFPTGVVLAYGRTDGGSDESDGPAPDKVVAVFQFSEKGFGFGEITIQQTKEGCFLDTEHMSRERVKRYLCALVDGAIADTDRDPERHELYNRVTGRRCGEGCAVCYPESASTDPEKTEEQS